jgi:hypothetical protein
MSLTEPGASPVDDANRVARLRGMREETRRLRRTLEAEPALRREAAQTR